MKFTNAIYATVAICLAIGVFSTNPVDAQGLFGTISGTITDRTGAIIPGAQVMVANINTSVVATAETNSAGVYNIPNLNPGVYRVEASAKGFKNAVRSGIVLNVSANPMINVTLEIGAATETVTVTGESPLLQTQVSSLGTSVDEQQLQELPVASGAGRSAYNLISLSAGVTQQVGEGGFALDNARLNGGRPRQDDYLMDGTSSQEPTFGGPAVNPSVDSLEELQVVTNNFSAEYGKVSGGVFVMTTKSGTNKFHGSAYEFYQTSKLDTNSYFSNLYDIPIAPSHFDEFGGTIGGPLKKGKIFFFTDYQGVRASSASTVAQDIVPTDAFKSGNLSALCTTGFSSGGICNNASQQLHNPATGQPYLNNQVPVSSIAKALEPLFPEGNGGTSNVVGGNYWNGIATHDTTINRFNPRGDWFLGKNDHVFGVYHYQRETYPWNTVGWIDSAGYSRNPDDSVTAGWSHTFSSSLINEFHFGYNHHSPFSTPSAGYGQAGPSDFGIQGIPACNLPGSNGKCGPPYLSITGFGGVGAGRGMMIEPEGQTEYRNSLTWVFGRHTLKLGGEIRRAHINNIQPDNISGDFSFNGSGTGNSFGDFLIGYLYQSSIEVQQKYLMVHTWADALFAQDDWKVTKALTLNLGLRWQYDPSWVEENHQLASFDPYTLTWKQNGLNGAPEGAIETHWKEFGPRLGFAWNPRRGFVVRGGYGISYPGVIAHGRTGDGEYSPNTLQTTEIAPGTYFNNLPIIPVPNPTAPLTYLQAEYSFYTPYQQSAQYSQMWNLTVEKQLGQTSILSLSYVGSHGVHLPVNYAYNLCQQSAASIAKYGNQISTWGTYIDSPYCAPGNSLALGGFYDDYVYPGYWGLSSSVYDALEVKYEKRYSHGVSILSNFTWSKLLDDSSSDWGGLGALDVYGQDFYHRSSERSVSAGDIPLKFSLAPIYDLPFGRDKKWANHGVAAELAGGFRFTGIYTLTKGDPVGISDGGYLYCNPSMTDATRPMLVGNPEAVSSRSIHSWFNTNAFDWKGTCAYYSNLYDSENPYSGDPAYSFGNTPRYLGNVRGPDYNNLDASLQKAFDIPYIGEQGRLRLQLDGFNVLNHPAFLPPVGAASPQFGQILGTRNNGRVVQLGAHLAF